MMKIEVFNLNDIEQKDLYEVILNKYPIVRDEFTYSKAGEAIITVWYLVEE